MLRNLIRHPLNKHRCVGLDFWQLRKQWLGILCSCPRRHLQTSTASHCENNSASQHLILCCQFRVLSIIHHSCQDNLKNQTLTRPAGHRSLEPGGSFKTKTLGQTALILCVKYELFKDGVFISSHVFFTLAALVTKGNYRPDSQTHC